MRSSTSTPTCKSGGIANGFGRLRPVIRLFNTDTKIRNKRDCLARASLQLKPLDILFARNPSGGDETLQVVDGGDENSFIALWKGKVLKLKAEGEGTWTTETVGTYPPTDGELARSFPSLQGRLLEELHTHAGVPPASVSGISLEYSLEQLEAAVEGNAAPWCDGTQPGAPERTPLQSQTLTAGELVALMQGKRGVVIVQLWNGFERSRGQPLYDPWVIHLVEAALRTPGVRAVPSVAPGGVGLTAVLYADREPWSSWGPHLATFGCQANAVAGSAYYKVLIGKILGYKEENIYGYVRSVGGGLSPAVISQVDADLKRLSKAKPKLPWNREGSRGKKGTPAAPAGTGTAGGGRPGAGARPATAARGKRK